MIGRKRQKVKIVEISMAIGTHSSSEKNSISPINVSINSLVFGIASRKFLCMYC